MNRRTAVAFVFSLALGQPLSGWAQREQNASGDAQTGNNGESSGRQDNSAEGRESADPATNSARGADTSDKAVAPRITRNEHSTDVLSQDDTLAAVEDGDAIPLGKILPDVRNRTTGEVIEVKLLRSEGFLVYAITVLDTAGRVSVEYYHAGSGIHLEER